MYGAEDPSIAGMVLDSPFSDLVDLMMELVDTYKIRLPKFTVKFAIHYMRRAILKKAKFDIMESNTIKVAKSCFVPVLFGHAVEDDFIQPHHSDRIFEAYVGDKNIIKFEGDHNSPRPQFYFDSISIFFNIVLQPPVDEDGGTFFDMSHDYFGRGTWSTTVDDARNFDDHLSAPVGPAAISTEDAIKQLRSKRLISRTEVPSDVSSKDEQSETQEGGSRSDSVASSSKMISFELANGDPYGPHVPASIDDDEYVEYSFDNLADFPNNVEEEERMFMVAVLESLKDLEVKHPGVEEPSSNAGNEPPPEPSQKDDQEDSSNATKPLPIKEEPSLTLAASGPDLAPQLPLPDANKESNGTTTTTVLCPPAENSGPSPLSDTKVSNQSASDSDVVDTKATVTVEKNPSSNIMDGLLRRWDLNFFRNR